jgi:hypothetical protein
VRSEGPISPSHTDPDAMTANAVRIKHLTERNSPSEALGTKDAVTRGSIDGSCEAFPHFSLGGGWRRE